VLDCLHGCYAAFKGRLAGARDVWSCRCDACARVDSLDLKFVLHAGPFIIQSMRGGTELVGGRPYALISEAAAAMFDVPWDESLPLLEQYEHLPPVGVRVIVLA